MGFSKLREWVETVTGKGDRWEGDRQSRSEPAFGVAGTIVLPPPTCTARQEAGQRRLRLLFCCEAGQLLAVVSLRPVPDGLSAACVRLQRPCSAGFVACCRLCHAMPTALIVLAPVQCCFAPCSFHVRQDRRKLLYELSRWQLQHGPAVAARASLDSYAFLFTEVIDPGPWLV